MKFTEREINIILNALSTKSLNSFSEHCECEKLMEDDTLDGVDKEYYKRRADNFLKDSQECDSVWIKVYYLLDEIQLEGALYDIL